MKSIRESSIDLDDLRVFVVVASSGSLSHASRKLGMSVATVSRRVERLEEALERKLFRRHSSGLTLTPESEELLEYARSVMDRVYDFLRASEVKPEDALQGTVTITTIESIVTRILAPSLGKFREQYPGIKLVLRSEPRNVDLSRRSADIAIRVARPTENRVVAQKIGTLSFGLYASQDYIQRKGLPENPTRDLSGHDLITYDERYTTLPEVAWFHVRASTEDMAVRVYTAAAIHSAVRGGAGLGILPTAMAGPDLVCVCEGQELPQRDIWLVMHEDLQSIPRVRAVFEYLRELLKQSIHHSEWKGS